MPPRQLTYIFNPTAQVIGLNPIPKNYQVIFPRILVKNMWQQIMEDQPRLCHFVMLTLNSGSLST